MRTVCQRQRQRSGGEVGRAQETFLFEHLRLGHTSRSKP